MPAPAPGSSSPLRGIGTGEDEADGFGDDDREGFEADGDGLGDDDREGFGDGDLDGFDADDREGFGGGGEGRRGLTGPWPSERGGTGVPSSARSTTSSGVPSAPRIPRTAAGLSSPYVARRRSISFRSVDTSRALSLGGSCRCWARSPTRLR
ncbi:hypothetical protein [Streptomyces sp. NBC_00090]|uniref:hypothetical protein n=1 Tax=Streptomyces sp. NBC_00090 TaxID=2903619 RepID=UPI003863E85C